MIKNNKIKLIISSLIILFPMVLFAVVKEKEVRFAIGCTSGIMLLVHLIAIIITDIDNRKRAQSPKVLGLLFWICPMISLLVFCVNCALILDVNLKISVFVGLILGVAMIIFGNYLPKCKQNFVIGIRISFTLASEDNWNKTHRFSGRLWVVGGILMLLCSLLPDFAFIIAMVTIVLIISLTPILYSYLHYKKSLKEGELENVELLENTKKRNKKYLLITLIFTVILLAFLLFISLTGSIEIEFSADSFTVDASFYSEATISYADIESVELCESVESGIKIMGFNSLRLHLGSFQSDDLGSHTRYIYTNCESCVVLKAGGRTILVNGETNEDTLAIYETLIAKTEG